MEEPFEEKPEDEEEIVDGEAEEVDLSADESEITGSDDPTIKQESVLEEPEFDAEATIRQEPATMVGEPGYEATTARPSIYDDEEEEGGLPILPLVLGGLAAMCGLVLIVGAAALFLIPGLTGGGGKAGSEEPQDGPTPTVERTLIFPTATVGPTERPTETEVVEEEEEESEDETTPTAEPTATKAPVQNPTNPPPPPPPTDTPPPPPPLFDIPGLTGVNFWVDNPVVAANERISFNFSVTNEGTESIIFGPLGVAIKDAGGTTIDFHTSWTRWELEPEKTENWNDGVMIGNPGSYLLELSACIPTNDDHCDVSGGDWYALFNTIAVTVN